MAQSNNFLSLLFCFWKNGQYVSFPLFEDLDANDIVYIRIMNVPQADGVLAPAFVITAQNPKAVENDVYYVSTHDFIASLSALTTLLNATSTQNSFTTYTNLLSLQGFEVYDTTESIVINDLWTRTRKYNVGADNTLIVLNLQTDLIYFQVIVDGDQTVSGPYYYNTYLV